MSGSKRRQRRGPLLAVDAQVEDPQSCPSSSSPPATQISPSGSTKVSISRPRMPPIGGFRKATFMAAPSFPAVPPDRKQTGAPESSPRSARRGERTPWAPTRATAGQPRRPLHGIERGPRAAVRWAEHRSSRGRRRVRPDGRSTPADPPPPGTAAGGLVPLPEAADAPARGSCRRRRTVRPRPPSRRPGSRSGRGGRPPPSAQRSSSA